MSASVIPSSVHGSSTSRPVDESSKANSAPPLGTAAQPFSDVISAEHVWTVRDIGRNCISAIINDPSHQSKYSLGLKQNKENVVPQVPQTMLRKVRYADFEMYSKHIQPVYDKFLYNRTIGLNVATEGTPTLSPIESTGKYDNSFAALLSRYTPSSPTTDKDRTTQRKLLSINVPALDSVPSIFFSPDFHLETPQTFSAVVASAADGAQDILNPANVQAFSQNQALQEKLMYQLDTVEIHLIKEISRRSTQFFAALSNLQVLSSETRDCVAQIANLRSKLQNISKINAEQGLEVVMLKRRRGNFGVLYNGIKLVQEVKSTQPMIQVLLGQGDYVGALDLIEETSKMLRGLNEPRSPNEASRQDAKNSEWIKRKWNLDLREVKPLKHFNGQLTEMTKNIAMIMENDLTNLLVSDIKETLALMDPKTKIALNVGPKIIEWANNIMAGKMLTVETKDGAIIGAVVSDQEYQRIKLKITPVVLGLLRMDRLGDSLDNVKDALKREVKSLMKRLYPILPEDKTKSLTLNTASTSVPTQSTLTPMAKYLKTLQFEPFFNLISNIFIHLLHLQLRTAIFQRASIEIIKDAQDRGVIIGDESLKAGKENASGNPGQSDRRDDDDDELGKIEIIGGGKAIPTSPEPITGSTTIASTTSSTSYNGLLISCADLLYLTSDESQTRCAKLISIRQDMNTSLASREFFRLFNGTWEFINAGEYLAGRTLPGSLKGTMVGQAKQFFHTFHDTKLKQLAMLIESEQWAQSDVPYEFQELTDQIILGSTGKDPRVEENDWRKDIFGESLESLDADDLDDVGGQPASKPKIMIDASKKKLKDKSASALIIEGRKYYVVGASLMFLRCLSEYIQCMENIQVLTVDVMNKILEMLKVFNSRTCQVILGAGALKSAGLANITTKHIALAAQSVGVLIVITPHLKSLIAKNLTPRQQILLADYDRMGKDFLEHQNELYGRLVRLMEDRLQLNMVGFMNFVWDESIGEGEIIQPNAYVLKIVKDTTVLHRILSKYIEAASLKPLMGQVLDVYNKKLEEQMQKLDIFTVYAKHRLLVDMQYLIRELSALNSVDGPGNHLEVSVNNLIIKDRKSVSLGGSSASSSAISASGQQYNTTNTSSSSKSIGKGGMSNIFGVKKEGGAMSSLFGMGGNKALATAQPAIPTGPMGGGTPINSETLKAIGVQSAAQSTRKVGEAFAKMFKSSAPAASPVPFVPRTNSLVDMKVLPIPPGNGSHDKKEVSSISEASLADTKELLVTPEALKGPHLTPLNGQAVEIDPQNENQSLAAGGTSNNDSLI